MKSGCFFCPHLRKLAADLLGEPIQAALVTEKSAAIAEEVRKLLLDAGEHLGAEWNAVIGEHWIELGRGNYHFKPIV